MRVVFFFCFSPPFHVSFITAWTIECLVRDFVLLNSSDKCGSCVWRYTQKRRKIDWIKMLAQSPLLVRWALSKREIKQSLRVALPFWPGVDLSNFQIPIIMPHIWVDFLIHQFTYNSNLIVVHQSSTDKLIEFRYFHRWFGIAVFWASTADLHIVHIY